MPLYFFRLFAIASLVLGVSRAYAAPIEDSARVHPLHNKALLGMAIGTPGGVNWLVAGYYGRDLGFRAEAGLIGKSGGFFGGLSPIASGAQINLAVPVIKQQDFLVDVSAVVQIAGYSPPLFSKEEKVFGFGISAAAFYKGFFFEAGVVPIPWRVVGLSNVDVAPILQLGYLFAI